MELIKAHQQKIALVVGFAAVAAIGFWGGKAINQTHTKPAVSASSIQSNYTETKAAVQTEVVTTKAQTTTGSLDCAGKIKGSSSRIYHVPGDAFYKRTTKPIACFDTEAEATAAGFTKSSK